MISPPIHNKNQQGHAQKQEAFLKLYEPVNARLSRFCFAMLRNREDARDLISETLLTAYENFEKLRNPEAFLYFLFGIAAKHIRHKERRKKFWGFFEQTHADNIKDTSSQPEAAADLSILYDAIATLPYAQREALVLFEVSGLSLEEIQEVMGGSLSGVKSNVARARKKLVEKLGIKEEDYKIKSLKGKEASGGIAENKPMPFTEVAVSAVPLTITFQNAGK